MENASVLKRPFYIKTWHLFFLILLGICINTWIIQNHVMTREVYHNILSERMEAYRIDDYFNFVRRLSIWSYIIAPLILWIRLTLVTLLLQFPLVFRFIDLSFKRIFRIVSFAQISFLVAGFLKTFWIMRLQPYQITVEDLSTTPLALTNILEPSSISKASHIILSNFNIFEIIWCLIVVKGFVSTGKLKTMDVSLIVLVVWTLLLVFQWALVLYLIKISS